MDEEVFRHFRKYNKFKKYHNILFNAIKQSSLDNNLSNIPNERVIVLLSKQNGKKILKEEKNIFYIDTFYPYV